MLTSQQTLKKEAEVSDIQYQASVKDFQSMQVRYEEEMKKVLQVQRTRSPFSLVPKMTTLFLALGIPNYGREKAGVRQDCDGEIPRRSCAVADNTPKLLQRVDWRDEEDGTPARPTELHPSQCHSCNTTRPSSIRTIRPSGMHHVTIACSPLLLHTTFNCLCSTKVLCLCPRPYHLE